MRRRASSSAGRSAARARAPPRIRASDRPARCCISGWSDQPPAERAALPAVMKRLRDGRAHARGRADKAVEARHRHHVDDGARRRGLPRRPSRPGPRAARSRRKHWRRCPSCASGARSASGSSLPSGRQRGRRKQVRPPGGLRQDQEGIAHRRGHEELVADELVGALPVPPPPIGKARVVLARTSDPPCFSVIAMPMVSAGLLAAGTLRGS